MFSSWLGWGRGGGSSSAEVPPAAAQQQQTTAQLLSNVPPPPVPSPGVSPSAAELHRFVYERCGPDFSPDAINELYAFVTVFSGSPNNASGVAIDGARVYMAGSTPETKALMVPLVPLPSAGGSHPSPAPLLVRIAATYKNPRGGAAPREAVVSINVPPAARAAFAVNPAAASYVDAESLVVLVPQRSSTLVNYARDIVARVRRTPPLVACGDAAAAASSSWPPSAPSATGNPYPAANHGDGAASASPMVEQLLTTLRHAAETELGATAGRLDVVANPARLELLLPVVSNGRRAHVPIDVEVQLATGRVGGGNYSSSSSSSSSVPPLRSRVRPPSGCALVPQGYASPCDANGYVTRLERAAAAEALLQLASARTASAYLRELAAELGARFPYTNAAAAAAASDTEPGPAPVYSDYGAAGNPYGVATSSSSTSIPPDVEPYHAPSSSAEHAGSCRKDPAPPPPPPPPPPPLAAPGAAEAPEHCVALDSEAGSPCGVPDPGGDAGGDEATPSMQPHQLPATAAAMPAAGSDDNDGDDACVICLDAPREYVCVPCGHRVLCEACRANFPPGASRCPTCRAEVQATMKVFL